MRYAIYFLPASDTALWRFGSSVVGYDACTGQDVAPPNHPYLTTTDRSSWTREPARYGFHATLKAPFVLAAGKDEPALLAAADAFAREYCAFDLAELAVRAIGSFIALVPTEPSAAVQRLAGDCTRAFDAFRAPLSEADRRRRLESPLTERQIENLDRWGYPYVLDDFRFHMTLTGPLDAPARDRLLPALSDLYATIAAPVTIDAITVCRQETRESRFVALQRFPFRDAPQ